jgi:lysophospholipase
MLEQAPYFADVAHGPDGACAYWTRAEDDIRLRVGHFPANGQKGSVLLFPGRTEYIEKYAPAAADFGARGYNTLVIDWRGQGLSDRLLPDRRIGHIETFDDYQKDMTAMLDVAEQLDLPKPWYLVGHSMGGCIGLRALYNGLEVEAAGFTGPMWGINLATPTRPVAWALSHLAGWSGQGHRLPPGMKPSTYVLSDPFEDNTLTTDRAMHDFMREQLTAHPDLALGGPSLVWLREALIETRALAQMAAPDLPCLTFLGTNERIVDAARIHNRMASWPKGLLDLVEGGEHEVMMETTAIRKSVFDGFDDLFSATTHDALDADTARSA